jgi:hypothetical protein
MDNDEKSAAKPMSFQEYRDERKALGERMAADDEQIRKYDRMGDEEWRVGNVQGVVYSERMATAYDKDLHATAEKEQSLDRDYWGQVEKEHTGKEVGAGAENGADNEAGKAAATGGNYWDHDKAEKASAPSVGAEAKEERQADVGTEKSQEAENSL